VSRDEGLCFIKEQWHIIPEMCHDTQPLTFLAAQTKRVLLGTGIIILPQRNPLVLAKELASLDELSEGRLLFGVGVGYEETAATLLV